MQKDRTKRLKVMTVGAMMAALSIILERFLPITPPSNMMDIRITLSNIPIILASVLVSPIAGALCGVVSDIIGCFISGYAPFPILTLAPLVMGLLPGIAMGKKGKYSFVKVLLTITVTHILASVLITTLGLCVMKGAPFIPMLITRLPSCGINLVIDVTLVYILLKSPLHKKI